MTAACRRRPLAAGCVTYLHTWRPWAPWRRGKSVVESAGLGIGLKRLHMELAWASLGARVRRVGRRRLAVVATPSRERKKKAVVRVRSEDRGERKET